MYVQSLTTSTIILTFYISRQPRLVPIKKRKRNKQQQQKRKDINIISIQHTQKQKSKQPPEKNRQYTFLSIYNSKTKAIMTRLIFIALLVLCSSITTANAADASKRIQHQRRIKGSRMNPKPNQQIRKLRALKDDEKDGLPKKRDCKLSTYITELKFLIFL